MDSRELLLNSLDQRGETYQENLKRCRDDFSNEAVHDLRTSIRRLLATLEIADFVISGSAAKKLSNRLEEQLDDLSDLRDAQVMLDRVSETIDTMPELEPLQNYLETREKKKRRAGEKDLQDVKVGGISKRLIKVRQAIEELSPEEMHDKLPQAVDKAYLTVMQRYGEVDPAQLVSIHHLRIAFKNFRYMVEMIYPCLPGFPESQLKRMHEYHDQMGDIHDIQVFLEILAEFAEENNSYDPGPVRRYYERILAKDVSVYLKNKAQVLTFWRANPLAAFPWEADPSKKE